MICDDRCGATSIEPIGRDADMEALALLLRYAVEEAERLGLHVSSHHAEVALHSMYRPGGALQS